MSDDISEEAGRAADVLRAGGLVAFPTETVYGLGADAGNERAIRRIFDVKGRPPTHPLIVHIAATDHLERVAAVVPPEARALARAFWPGPLTLVLPRAQTVSPLVTGGRDTVGVRVPDHLLTLAMLRAFGGGVAAPSANRFGRVSPTTAAHVRADLGDEVDLILDGGPCAVGVESTIVELVEEPTILRHGGVPVERIEEVLGRAVRREATGPARAPGMLAAHYAPSARVVVVEAEELRAAVERARADGGRVGVLAPGAVDVAGVEVLEPAGDAERYARVLYARLREADARGLDRLVVVPPPAEGIGVAVRDRLRRAAAGSAGSEAP